MSVTFTAGIETHKAVGDRILIGFDEVEGSPRLNFSNANARHLLFVVGLEDEDLCGAITDLAGFKRKLIRGINQKSWRTLGVRPELSEGNFYDMGQSDEAVLRKLNALLELADFAQKQEEDVVISYG
jgi:hypothetical protein